MDHLIILLAAGVLVSSCLLLKAKFENNSCATNLHPTVHYSCYPIIYSIF